MSGRRVAVQPAEDHASGGTVDKKLLDIIACPICKGPLEYRSEAQELVCKADRLAYRIENDMPVMLVDEARAIPEGEEP